MPFHDPDEIYGMCWLGPDGQLRTLDVADGRYPVPIAVPNAPATIRQPGQRPLAERTAATPKVRMLETTGPRLRRGLRIVPRDLHNGKQVLGRAPLLTTSGDRIGR